MADIAARLGVSTVTVSKALGDKDGVSDELRAKIKEIAVEMGYRGSGGASSQSRAGTGNIGILVPSRFLSKSNSFYWNMYERITSRLLSGGYYGFLEVIKQEDEDGMVMPRLLMDSKADGLIAIGQLGAAYSRYLRGMSPIPIVFLDSYDAQIGEDSVISDGYYGMYTVTSHLIKKGHKDIIFVGSINATSSISDRYFGYCRAMSEHNLLISPDMVLPDRDGLSGQMIIELPSRLPTAFACNCDMAAYMLISKLSEQGLNVPEDISVVGFDDYFPPNLTGPEVTTYAVDVDNMTRICVEWIIRKIHNKSYSTNLRIVSGKLIEKDSVKDINP